MVKSKSRWRGVWRTAVLAAALAVALIPVQGSAAGADNSDRVASLQAQASSLSAQVVVLSDQLSALMPQGGASQAPTVPVMHVAQTRDLGSLQVRVDQLEEQLRTLTGQVQGLQFQMTQLQSMLQKMQDDNEFRFQQLEGGQTTPKKTDAAPKSGSVKPTGGSPQTSNEQTAPADLTPPDDGANGDVQLGAPPHSLGTLPESALNDASGVGAQPLGADSGTSIDLGGQPLDQGYDPNNLATSADAEAQYKAGYDAVVRGDYSFAEDQFRQFIALYPDDPKAPDAVNWLGEALLQRGAYSDAADTLFNGFQKYQKSTRAPDILLRLGIALTGTDQPDSRDTACRTFLEVLRRYPDLTPAFKAKVSEAQRQAQC